MQQTTGRAALVALNLPTAKTVTNATNATPIVVTTSAPHLLQTNEIIAIAGVGGNAAANGTFVASVLTGTTVALLAYPAGTSVAGTGPYTSGGSLLSAGFGLTVPVPNDLTDQERVQTVNIALEALLDRTAYLQYLAGDLLLNTKVDRAGDTMTGLLQISTGSAESLMTSGNIFAGGDVDLGNVAETLAVTNATNATPIVVTTSAHNLSDGAQVTVASVGGNAAANGTWVVDVLTTTTFSLVGSVGSGAYTSGGTVTVPAQVRFGSTRTDTRTLRSYWNSSASATSGNRYWITFFGSVINGWSTVQADPTTQQMWFGFEIDVPQGAKILSATVYFQPPSGHGSVPNTVSAVTVTKVALATGAASSLAVANNPNTGSVVAYEVYTPLTATLGTPEIVDNSRNRYSVYVSSETGANAISAFQVFGGTVTFTVPGVDQF